jgi:hypothetical protein
VWALQVARDVRESPLVGDQKFTEQDVRSGECLTTLHVDGVLAGCAWFPDGERTSPRVPPASVFSPCLEGRVVGRDLLPFQWVNR